MRPGLQRLKSCHQRIAMWSKEITGVPVIHKGVVYWVGTKTINFSLRFR